MILTSQQNLQAQLDYIEASSVIIDENFRRLPLHKIMRDFNRVDANLYRFDIKRSPQPKLNIINLYDWQMK